MARFPDGWLSELYSRNDIVDVVSAHTSLTERSGRFWGLCPFHKEKTPSFSVSRDKQVYYCFGCKQGGNVVNFVMKAENVSFGEAIEILSRRAGMELPDKIDDKEYMLLKRKKQQIKDLNKLAARYYHETLFSPQGRKAFEYLKNRGIDEPVMKRFGLGYAPDGWDSVLELARSKGVPDETIRESGLVLVKNNNMYDAFRGRVMFPIFSPLGEVVAFGGRVLGDGTPKYLNTKETLVFNKRRNLYGIDLIRRMAKVKSAVLVEGYMDVVSLCAHGVKAAVASLGTALTKEQAALLKRYTSEVFVAYDGDEAGEIATMKAIETLSAAGFRVRVIRFGDGLDPDEFVKTRGLKGFAQLVKNAPDSISYKLEVKKKEFDVSTADGKERYAIAAAKIIEGIESPIIKERYIKKLAEETGFSPGSISGEAQKKGAQKNSNANNRYNRIEKTDDGTESLLLAFLLGSPAYAQSVSGMVSEEDFSFGPHKNIFSALLGSVKKGIQPTYAELISELGAEEDVNEAARLSGLQVVADDPGAFLKDCAAKLKKERLMRRRLELAKLLQTASGAERSKLLAEISELDKEFIKLRV